MHKIPTVFVRNPENMDQLLRDVHPDCQWVADGEGRATRKYDGTCIKLDAEGTWWARRQIRPNRQAPAGFVLVETDEVTGKSFGWEPIEQSVFYQCFQETTPRRKVTTYELIGPKINGNPQKVDKHMLIEHGANVFTNYEELAEVPRDYDGLRDWLAAHDSADLRGGAWEGIVFHHEDGRMAKIKARDLMLA